MNRLEDEEIGDMWAKNYPRRREKSFWLVLTALVHIIKGNSLIIASRERGDYLDILAVSLLQCNVPAAEFSEIEKSKAPR